MRSYIIGVDGGGTKTLGALFDLDGNLLKQAISGFGNFNVDSNLTIKHLKDVLRELTEDMDMSEIAMIQIGIAGYSNFEEKEDLIADLNQIYPVEISIVTDAEIALYSVKKDSDKNVIMILGGTGSVVMVENKGKIAFIGGFGHLLGDEGSGYHLVITALKNIIDQYEKAESISPLTNSILKEIKAEKYSEIKNFVYNNQKSEVAKLSQFIAKHALSGNEEAIHLFIQEGEMLAEQAIRAYNTLDSNEVVLIGMKGGFLLNAPFVKETLIKVLNQNDMKYIMDDSRLDPVCGAYYLAKNHLQKR